MALLTLDCEVQMYEKRLELEIQRKVARSVVAAEISDHLNAFSNISRRGSEIVSYLSVSLSISPLLCPYLHVVSLSSIPKTAPHLFSLLAAAANEKSCRRNCKWRERSRVRVALLCEDQLLSLLSRPILSLTSVFMCPD